MFPPTLDVYLPDDQDMDVNETSNPLYPETGEASLLRAHIGHSAGETYNWYGALGPAKAGVLLKAAISAEFSTTIVAGSVKPHAVAAWLREHVPSRALPSS